jgi:hypothetical protein
MPTDIRDKGPGTWHRAWPQQFTERQKFTPETENKSYIEFLQAQDVDEVGEEGKGDEIGSGEDINRDGSRADTYIGQNGHDTIKGYSTVRLFMRGTLDENHMRQYSDQVEQVVGFCDQNVADPRKRAALLDDRTNGGYSFGFQGYRRPYLGPLTAQQLWVELSKKVSLL